MKMQVRVVVTGYLPSCKLNSTRYNSSSLDHSFMRLDSRSNFDSLPALLRSRAEHAPDRVGFRFLIDGEAEEETLSYQDLDRQAREIMACLAPLKLAGERALLIYPPGLKFISAFFGCLYSGLTAVPVYPPRAGRLKNTIAYLSDIVSDAQPSVIMTTSELRALLQRGMNESDLNFGKVQWLITDQLSKFPTEEGFDGHAGTNPLALLQYTSGSTSAPRGVMVTHENLLHNSAFIHKAFGHSEESVGVIWLPPYHDMGLIGGILQPLFGGFPVILMSPFAMLQRPFRWLQAITKYRATTSGGPNFAYDLCVRRITAEQRAMLDLGSWDVAFNGAEPIRSQTLNDFVKTFGDCGFRAGAFLPCYGLAEATLAVATKKKGEHPVRKIVDRGALQYKRASASSHSNDRTITLMASGHPAPAHDVRIVDPDSLSCCPPDRTGEIWMRSPSVARGYWNRPEQTQQIFGSFLADTCEGPFLRTGDLGFISEGELFVTGRLKDLIIIRGRNHHPEDIELTVEQANPGISPTSVAFTIETNCEERLIIVAELQRQQLRCINQEEVKRSIRKCVAEQHELEAYEVLLMPAGTIPRTTSGKLQRHACKKLLETAIFNSSRRPVQGKVDRLPLTVDSGPTALECA